MRALDIKHAEIGTVTSRNDGAVKFTVITPELKLDERATVLGFHGRNVRVMIEPLDVPVEGLDEVTSEAKPKTQCARIRAKLFVLWTTENKPGTFDEFYHGKTERILERIGEMIEGAKK